MGQKFIEFWESHSGSVLAFAGNIAVAAAILAVSIILSKGMSGLIKRTASKGPQYNEAVTSLLRAVVRYGVFLICGIMILNVFGINTASLLALLGAAGVAIGLALRDTLSNIAAGIILIVLGIYRKGDFIESGSFSGTVKDINIFTTILETPDGICVTSPNSGIWGGPVRNFTRNGKRRMELSVSIALTDSVDAAFQAAQNIIDAETRILKDPAPQIILQAVQDGLAKIAVRAWASVQDYWDVHWDLSKNLKAGIEAAGLHIPPPQREVRVVHEGK